MVIRRQLKRRYVLAHCNWQRARLAGRHVRTG
jgi:hypothetical protein